MTSLPIEGYTYPKRTHKHSGSNNIFIVHGHNDVPKLSLSNFLYKIGLNPIILHEQPNKGKTIIEKFEENAAMAGYAFILLTPDDVGGIPEMDLRYRARQNVILELGFFMGALGRDRVCCIYKGGVELPSDILGVVYVEYLRDIKECFIEITRELESAGYRINRSY